MSHIFCCGVDLQEVFVSTQEFPSSTSLRLLYDSFMELLNAALIPFSLLIIFKVVNVDISIDNLAQQ